MRFRHVRSSSNTQRLSSIIKLRSFKAAAGNRSLRISLIVTGHFANNVTGFSTRLRGV